LIRNSCEGERFLISGKTKV